MKIKLLILTLTGLSTALPIFAQQARTVTNADLEKYKNKRIQAERDYEQNYARMGFPSPEELQKQIEKSRIEREALAARLTAERIQREQSESQIVSQPTYYFVDKRQPNGAFFLGYPYYYQRPVPYFGYGRSYRVAGGMIFNNNNLPPRRRPIRGWLP